MIQSILKSVLEWLITNAAGVVVVALVGLLAKKFLPKVINSVMRARAMAALCHKVIDALDEKVEASPNKYDDVALKFIAELEQYAIDRGEELSKAEQAAATKVLQERTGRSPEDVARLISIRASLAPLKVQGIDLSGKDVK